MAAQDTTTAGFGNALKDIYLPNIRNQLNQKTRILKDFTKSDISQFSWEGNQAVVSLRSSRSNAVKATAEGGLLPTASQQGFDKLTIAMRFWESRIELTTQVMKAARSNKGAFARALDAEQSGIVEDISNQRNRALFMPGTGTLALANGSGAAVTTMELDTPGGLAEPGLNNGTRFLKAGMVIAIYKADGSAIDAVRTIASITDHDTLELSATATWEDNAILNLGAVSGATLEGSRNIEPVGLMGLVDSTTFLSTIHGLDRSLAANSFFRSTILASVGVLSPDILQRGVDNAEEVSGEVLDCYYCHSNLRREVLKLQEADRRYTQQYLMKPDIGTFAGGFKADLTFNGVPIKVEKHAPYGLLFGVSRENLFWIPEDEGSWGDEDGSVLSRVAGKDNYEAYFRVFENFFSDKGNAHVRFDGVTVTVSQGVYAD